MGQSSTFLTNRQGDFQFWNDIWDSKESFQKSNLENILIKNCLSVFLKNKNYINWRFFFIKNLNFWSTSFFLNTKPHELEDYWIEQKNIKKNNISIITCFIFKYQNWLVFFIYYHVVKKFVSKKKKIETILEPDALNAETNETEDSVSVKENSVVNSDSNDNNKELLFKNLIKNNALNKNKLLEYFDSDAYEDELDSIDPAFDEVLNSELDFEYFSDEELENLNDDSLVFSKNNIEDENNYAVKKNVNFLNEDSINENSLKVSEEDEVFGSFSSHDTIDYDDEDSYTLNFFDKKYKDIIDNGEFSDEEKEKHSDDEETEDKIKKKPQDSDSDSDDDDDDELYGRYYCNFNSLDNNFNTYSDFF